MPTQPATKVVLVVAEPWDFASSFGPNVARYRCWPTTFDGQRVLVGSADREIIWDGASYRHMLFTARHDVGVILPLVGEVDVNAYAIPKMTLERRELREFVDPPGPGFIGHLERPPECGPPGTAAVALHHARWVWWACRRMIVRGREGQSSPKEDSSVER